MEGYIAQIIIFGGTFDPLNWAFCHGQLLDISQNTALFSLLGTTYGGNGQTTFALPDFRGRVPIGTGQGPGLPNVVLGQTGGTLSVTLLTSNIPTHTHPISSIQLKSSTANASLTSPVSNVFANAANSNYAPVASATGTLGGVTGTTGSTGGNQPFNTQMPYLGLNFIICLEGIYPSRN